MSLTGVGSEPSLDGRLEVGSSVAVIDNATAIPWPGPYWRASGPDAGKTRGTDWHVWRVGEGSYARALGVVTHDLTLTADRVCEQLAVSEEIVHATVEIHRVEGYDQLL